MKCPQSATKLAPRPIRAFPSFPIEVCAKRAPSSPCLVADGTQEPTVRPSALAVALAGTRGS
jgi:hypothetical protein